MTLAYLWLPYMILPIYAGLDRLPDSLLEASADLGGRAGRTFRSVILPMIVPAIVAGLDLHLLAVARRLHRGPDRRRQDPAARQRGLRQHRRRQQPAVRGRARHVPVVVMLVYLPRSGAPARWRACDDAVRDRPGSCCGVLTVLVLGVIYVPLLLVLVNSFNANQTFAWPPRDFTLEWWRRAADNAGCAGRALGERAGRTGRDRDRAGARHDGRVRGAAVPVLRSRHGVAAGDPADRAAGHRHRHRAEQRVPDDLRRASSGSSRS